MTSTLALGDKVMMVLQDEGVAYVITTNMSLIRFRERETSLKLEVSKSDVNYLRPNLNLTNDTYKFDMSL